LHNCFSGPDFSSRPVIHLSEDKGKIEKNKRLL
jgi:hypothetical protein